MEGAVAVAVAVAGAGAGAGAEAGVEADEGAEAVTPAWWGYCGNSGTRIIQFWH
jgi:hypothetical protein